MALRVVRDFRVVDRGQDPFTKPVLDWLVSMGLPAEIIRRIELDSAVGDVQKVRIELFVPPEAGIVLPSTEKGIITP